MIKTDTLPQFLRNKVAENDAFGLVEGLCQLLRSSPTEKISPTLHLFKLDRKSTRLNSSHSGESRMPSSA